MARPTRTSPVNTLESARWRAADFEELKPERLDLGKRAVQRGAIRERSRQHGVRSARLSQEGTERQAQHLAEVAASPDLVLPGPWSAACSRGPVTGHEGQLATAIRWASYSSHYGEL